LTAGILLAAGQSRRFGGDKQLAMYGGESLLARSARLLIDAGLAPRVVVLAATAEAHRQALAGLDVEIALNSAPEKGISSSIQVGLRAVGSVDGAVITVCDQPFCTAEHLKLLVETARVSGAEIVASGYADVAGVPAFFRSTVFSRLENLTGNRGAAMVIRAFSYGDPDDLRVVPFPEGAIDIDTADDLAGLS
jgi:molybdenum cofactor cytidylyltransferase